MKKPIKKVPLNILRKDIFSRKVKKKVLFKKTFPKVGSWFLKSKEDFKICFSEIESVRRSVCFQFKEIKIWFFVDLNLPLSSKSLESRMGKGKGKLTKWVFNVKKGSIFMELTNFSSKKLAFKVLKLISFKLQAKVKILNRQVVYEV